MPADYIGHAAVILLSSLIGLYYAVSLFTPSLRRYFHYLLPPLFSPTTAFKMALLYLRQYISLLRQLYLPFHRCHCRYAMLMITLIFFTLIFTLRVIFHYFVYLPLLSSSSDSFHCFSFQYACLLLSYHYYYDDAYDICHC